MERTKVETSEHYTDPISDRMSVLYEVSILKDGERVIQGRVSKNGVVIGYCSGKSLIKNMSVNIDADVDLADEERILVASKCVEGMLYIFSQV